MRILWSPLALGRVEEIANYIAQDSPASAKKWVNTVFSKVRRLSRFPKSGRLLPEIERPDIREIFYGNYRIIYRIERGQVSILTVRHGMQRLPETELV